MLYVSGLFAYLFSKSSLDKLWTLPEPSPVQPTDTLNSGFKPLSCKIPWNSAPLIFQASGIGEIFPYAFPCAPLTLSPFFLTTAVPTLQQPLSVSPLNHIFTFFCLQCYLVCTSLVVVFFCQSSGWYLGHLRWFDSYIFVHGKRCAKSPPTLRPSLREVLYQLFNLPLPFISWDSRTTFL